MSKRPTHKVSSPKTRKRRRGGISMRTEVLEVPRPPPSTADEMQVWHTNIEQPTARKSYAPLPDSRKRRPQEPVERAVQYEEVLECPDSPIAATTRVPKKRNDSVNLFHMPLYLFLTFVPSVQTKMGSWIAFRTTILDELIRHDGLLDCDGPPTCAHCLDDIGTFKCLDCVQTTVYCSACIVQRHEYLPLHRVEVCSPPHVNPP